MRFLGETGNDYIYNSGDSLSFYGGDGNDSIFNSGSDVTIRGSAGNDQISLTDDAQNNLIQYYMGDGNDTVMGFKESDSLHMGISEYSEEVPVYSVATVGNDVVFTFDTSFFMRGSWKVETVAAGSITLKNAATLSAIKTNGALRERRENGYFVTLKRTMTMATFSKTRR